LYRHRGTVRYLVVFPSEFSSSSNDSTVSAWVGPHRLVSQRFGSTLGLNAGPGSGSALQHK
jgi:hypothetical protein